MRRGLKIVLFTVAGIGLLFIVFVAFVLFEIFRPQPEHHVSKEAQLSNGESCVSTASNTTALTAFLTSGMLLIKRLAAPQKKPLGSGEAAPWMATL